jgi:hypothetical protein
VSIDVDGGECEVAMPGYWPGINDTPHIHVTPCNHFGNGYGFVTEANKLVIVGEKAGDYYVALISRRSDSNVRKRAVEYAAPRRES